MAWPAFRTDPVASLRITWWSCALGYAVCLGGVPLAASVVYWLAVELLNDTGITRTAIGPALQYAERVVEYLMYSFIAAYMGAALSVPVVIWARLRGWFGWGTAMLTGVGVAIVVLGLLFQMDMAKILVELTLPSALLGLSFWITVRVIHPQAFVS